MAKIDLYTAPPDEYLTYQTNPSKEQLLSYLDDLRDFMNHDNTPHALLAEGQLLANNLADLVPEARMVLGSGYPYYVLDLPGNRQVPEFQRYIGEIRSKAEELKEGLACSACMGQNQGVDLKTLCKMCGSSIKAMDVVRILPDIDAIIVTDTVDDPMLNKVKGHIDENYYVLNEDIPYALKQSQQFMHSVMKAGKGDKKFRGAIHPDVMFLTTDQFVGTYQKIAEGNLREAKVTYTAYHNGRWGQYEDPFAEDLFLSRPYSPLVFRDGSLWQFAEASVSRFVKDRGVDQAVNEYLNYLKTETSGKNYRIASSSPVMEMGVYNRAQQYYEMT